MAGKYNFSMFNGETFDKPLTWSQNSTPVSQGGPPVDLSGYTATMSIGDVTDFITTTSSANGVITLGGAAGTIRLFIPASVVAQFINTAPFYRLFMIPPNNEPGCLLEGTYQVQP
jgi:hypothetical protein